MEGTHMRFDFEVNSGSSTHVVDSAKIVSFQWHVITGQVTLPVGSGYPAQQLSVRYTEALELFAEMMERDTGTDGMTLPQVVRQLASVVRKLALHHGSVVSMHPEDD
jgi:hypothetical protein